MLGMAPSPEFIDTIIILILATGGLLVIGVIVALGIYLNKKDK
jgi:hypothetical protein